MDYNTLQIDECYFLIMKIIEQAVKDYIALSKSAAPVEQLYYETACEFLFNDEYEINWDGENSTKKLIDLLNLLGIDLYWFRQKIIKLKNKKVKLASQKAGEINVKRQRQFKDEEEEEIEEELT